MKTVWTLLLLSLMMHIGCAAPKPLRAATRAELNTFRELWREQDAAFLRRDIQGYRKTLAPNYTVRPLSGKTLTRAQVLEDMSAFFRKIVSFNSQVSKVEKVGFRGRKAFVSGPTVGELMFRGIGGRVHRLKFVGRSVETWSLTRRGWLKESSVTTAFRSFLDGHEVPRR